MNLFVTDAIKEHQENTTDKIGLNLVLGMNDLTKTAFKRLAPVNVSKRLLKKRVRLIWFYPYNAPDHLPDREDQ